MNLTSSLKFAVVPDLGQPEEILLAQLTASERQQVNALPTERRRRQYLIGRFAAHEAIRQLLEIGTAGIPIEVLSELNRSPSVSVHGITNQIAISISHSSRLAVACAWFTHSRNLFSAGIDLEYVRQNQAAESYAFSQAERKILFQAPEGPELAALVGWTVKESVWKALSASQDIGPDAIVIRRQSLADGYALVAVKGQLCKRLGDSNLQVRMGQLQGPDGAYVFSIARVIPSESRGVIVDGRFDWKIGLVDRPASSAEMHL